MVYSWSNCKRIIPLMVLSATVGYMLGLFTCTTKFPTVYNIRRLYSDKLTYSTMNSTQHISTSNEHYTNKGPPTSLPAISGICSFDNCSGKVLSRNLTSWGINNKICSVKNDVMNTFFRTELRGPEKTPIFVYRSEEDVWVSRNIIVHGIWEGDLVAKIHDILKKDKDLVFLDIGANVGVFCLTAAKLGSRVIAIDALKGNIERLCKSMEAGHLTDKLILIHNAVSNKRERVALGVHHSNVGGTYVKKIGQNENTPYAVNSILLDDILEIFPKLSKVVIKLDVETFEKYVLEGATKFFKEVDVQYLLMEFVAHRKLSSGAFIANFLKENGLQPLVEANIVDDYSKWPNDVMFKKVKS